MRVSKSAKKQQPPPKDITIVLDRILDALKQDVKSDEQAQLGLVAALEPIMAWIFPRGDLTNWVAVLDGFDDVLEGLISSRAIVSLKSQPFTSSERTVILHILRVLKLLLVNCTNRKLFSSYDRLGDLMHSFDLEIIEAAMLVLIRSAMQYGAATPFVNDGEQTLQNHLRALVAGYDNSSSGWEQIRELGWDLQRLATDPHDFHLPPELRRLQISNHPSAAVRDTVNPSQLESPTSALRLGPETSSTSLVTPQRAASTANTPRKLGGVPTAPALVDLGDIETLRSSKSAHDIASELADRNVVQSESLFEAIAKIRFFLNLGSQADRQRLVSVRLLALATYCHIQQDETHISTLFIYNPEIIPQLIDLIPFDKGASYAIQAGSLMCLEALAKNRPTTSDVLTGLNANVNHGVLFTLIKGVVKRLVQDEADLPFDFVDGVLTMIAMLTQTPAHSAMMISAGILPLLLELLQTSSPTRSSFLPRAAGLLDSLVYSSPNAFGLFCNAGGLEVLNARIKAEIDMYLSDEKSAHNYDGQDSVMFNKITPLKSLLRSIHRMMQSSGTAEGLRNLIDSELPKSLKRIYQASDKLGPVVFGQAINILATFVHNEPTSLSTFQELELPQILYDRIVPGLAPSLEVILSVPNAIGAICLNQTGMDMTLAQPKLLRNMVMTMVSPDYDQIMGIPGNPRGIGASLDELVRHHPALRPLLLDVTYELLAHVKQQGNEFRPSKADQGLYTLLPGHSEEAEPTSTPITLESNPVMHHLSKVFGLLEGLLHQPAFCTDFLDKRGIDLLFEIMSLKCVPVNFASSTAGSAVVRILRIIAHTDGGRLLEELASHVDLALSDIQAFTNEPDANASFLNIVEYAKGATADRNGSELDAPQLYLKLCFASTTLVLFADAVTHISQQHPRLASAVLTNLAGSHGKRLEALGKLQRICTRQAIAAKVISDNSQPVDAVAAPDTSPTLPIDGSAANSSQDVSERAQAGVKDKPMLGYLKPVRAVTLRISGAVGSLLTGAMKALGRRHIDRSHSQAAEGCSLALAEVLAAHLASTVPADGAMKEQMEQSSIERSPNYRSFALGMASGLLFDDRTTNGSLQLPLYLSFQDIEGVEHLVVLANSILASVETLSLMPKDTRSPAQDLELLQALGNLQQVFSILRALASTKSLMESPQTTSLLQREAREAEQKFLPHARLVYARLEILPVAHKLWSAPWLSTTPQAVMRAAALTFLHIMQAQKEDPVVTPTRMAMPTFAQPVIGRQPLARRVAADPARIDQVAEMGFSRVQAENALIRARNDVAQATELLLMTPHLFEGPTPAAPPVTAPEEPEQHAADQANSAAISVDPAALDVGAQPGRSAEAEAANDAPLNLDKSRPPVTGLDAHKDCLTSLNHLRDLYKEEMAARAIALVDDCEDLVFDVRSAFPPGVGAIKLLLHRIEDVTFVYSSTLEKALAGRLRLLAVLCHGTQGETLLEIEQPVLQQILSLVFALSKLPLNPAPRWLAAFLLVADSLMGQAERITVVDIESPPQPVSGTAGLAGIRPQLLQACIEALHQYNAGGSSEPEHVAHRHDVFVATLRLLVSLTRKHDLAKAFASAGGLSLMLSTFKTPHDRLAACHPLVTMITRHLVEDNAVLHFTMQREIKRWINPNKTKVSDVTHFLRQIKQVVLRDPDVFLDAVEEECALLDPSPPQGVYHIRGKAAPSTGDEDQAPLTASRLQVDDPFSAATMSVIDGEGDGVIVFLFGEIEKAVKQEVAAVSPDATKGTVLKDAVSSSALGVAAALDKSSDPQSKAISTLQEAHEQKRAYICLLLQLLTELVGSYLPCKTMIIGSHRRKTLGSRPRPAYLSALINDWVSCVDFEDLAVASKAKKDQEVQTRTVISSWATSTVVAICADVTGSFDLKDPDAELVMVRKLIVDFIAKAITNVSNIHSESQRYGRLWSLAELVLRLLTSKPVSSAKVRDDSALHIAKIMLEKNFVALLTNALAEVDLEFPKIKLLLAMVIRPLEQLSKISIKIGNPDKKSVDETMDVDTSSGSESESEDGEIEEESDNLEGYRNSSLAMYTMGASDDEDDEDDEDDSEEIFDEEMGPEPDSDETSDEDDLDDGDDMDEDMMGNDDDELNWTDEDEEAEGDIIIDDNGEEAVFDFDQGDLMDINGEQFGSQGDEDEEDFEGEFDGPDEHDDVEEMDMDMDMDMEDGDMGSEDEDDESTAMRDMQRFAEEVGHELDLSDSLAMFENSDLPGGGPSTGPWGWVQAGATHGSRSSAEMLERSLGLSTGGVEGRRENLQHPLLTEPTATQLPPVGRRAPRGASGLTELFSNIENLLGHEAAQTLERLVHQGRLSGVDAIQIGLAQDESGEVRLSVGGRQIVMGAPEAAASPSMTAGLLSSFVPRPTQQRWSEEMSVVHGAFAPSRVDAMIVHVIARLLPAARQQAHEEAERIKRDEELRSEEEMEAEAVPDLGIATPEGHPATIEQDTFGLELLSAAAAGPSAGPSVDISAATETGPPAQDRVTVSIHGEDIDITDSGIDLDFLQALPDEMRADVVEQHMREQARQQQPAPSRAVPEQAPQINSEFLDALPPDIRAEVIQQEALEQARRSQASQALVTATAPTTFLASLDNDLRDVVLMDQTDALLGEAAPPTSDALQRSNIIRLASSSSRKKASDRDAIQLLDRQGVAFLVRLLFFPDVQRTNHLLKVMVYLCQNAKTRADLLDSMLSLLQDGSGEILSGERASQSTPRGAVKAVGTPRSTPRRRLGGPEVSTSFPLSSAPAATLTTFVAQRCLESLSYIVESNESALKYFITEHDLPAALKKIRGKAKGKDKLAPISYYPLVSLLALFERPALLHASHILEALTSIVALITKPIANLPPLEAGSAAVDASAASSLTTGQSGADAPNPVSGPVTNAGKAEPALEKAPVIPGATLRPIINVMTTGECSSRSFSHTLSLIQNLSHLPDAKAVFVDELSTRARNFGDALIADLEVLAGALSAKTSEEELRGTALAKFSPASSTQAQLLRVLKTLDFMFAGKESTTSDNNERQQRIRSIYDSFNFGPLWTRLGNCLEIVEDQAEATHVATVLLPLIEALMVVCKYSSAIAEIRERATTSPMSPLAPAEADCNVFITFTSKHRKILNTLVRNNPALMSGSFSILVLNSKVLEFDNKRNWFYQKLKRKREAGGVIQLSVRRQYVFEDSFQMLQRRSGDDIKYGKLSIKFHGEDGVDAGGVTREWYSVLAKQIFDPNFALFESCQADQLTYQPNKHSGVNTEHLGYFKFVGRVIGKAVFDNRLLDAYFSRAFYKQILGKPVDLRDLESIDKDYHNSLVWMLDNDITGVVDNDFTAEENKFGETKTVELKPGGAQIPVTQENKEEYVRLMTSYKLSVSIKEQIDAFLTGFYEIIPQHLVQIFQPDQLELLISGISTIDVDELKNATQLHGWKNSDPEITWFWRALRSFSQEERAHFLMFVTSSSRVPLGGFSQLQGSSGIQPFQIHKLHSSGALPSAATCFNLLKLGSYPSYESLRAKLLFAMYEGGGFGLA